jgi:hypothetical protein
LDEAGARLDPPLALTVVSLMIDPSLTTGERFTIAHQESGARVAGSYLHVSDGAPLTVSDAPPLAPVAATIVCPADSLLLALAGDRAGGVFVRGDERPLGRLAEWVQAAQSA